MNRAYGGVLSGGAVRERLASHYLIFHRFDCILW